MSPEMGTRTRAAARWQESAAFSAGGVDPLGACALLSLRVGLPGLLGVALRLLPLRLGDGTLMLGAGKLLFGNLGVALRLGAPCAGLHASLFGPSARASSPRQAQRQHDERDDDHD